MDDRLTGCEERIAHLERVAEDLSDLTRAQAARIATLERQVAALMAREADRAADTGGAVVLGDERPPHW